MKTSHFIYALIAILLFASCGKVITTESLDSEGSKDLAQLSGGYQEVRQKSAATLPSQKLQKKKLVPICDESLEIVAGSISVPESWGVIEGDDEVFLQGSQGIKMYKDISNFYYYSTDKDFNELMRTNEDNIKAPLSIEEVLLKEIKPLAECQGYTLITSYSLKEMADADSCIDAMYYKMFPETTIFRATVSEWEDANGKPSIVVVKYRNSTYNDGLMSWGYTLSGIESDRASFQQVKKDYLYALIHIEMNPEYILTVNKNTRQIEAQNNYEVRRDPRYFPEKDRDYWGISEREYDHTVWGEYYSNDTAKDSVPAFEFDHEYIYVPGNDYGYDPTQNKELDERWGVLESSEDDGCN